MSAPNDIGGRLRSIPKLPEGRSIPCDVEQGPGGANTKAARSAVRVLSSLGVTHSLLRH